MPNRLAQETSPYLRQHRDNPVDWYPWGEEALSRAREEDLPILLSVGYSACHWCHVMERESFEDAETAAYMNAHFVSVKVDREERPDVDAIYMEAVQTITGRGGWPMTVFLDPDGVPFYGGTYFPPDESRGMPSFRMVMEAIVDAYENRREEIRERASSARAQLSAVGEIEPDPELPGAAELESAVRSLIGGADRQHGGFGGAPKFPPASALELLLTRGETAVVEETLDAMLAGGIYDQVGGGFARYSVDAVWLVPHFEKMLYDNALLARAYLHGWQRLGHERYRRVCEETLDWMLCEMRGPEGGFYSALDADSEGVEGRFYVWTPEQIREVLGDPQIPRSFSTEQIERLLGFWGVTDAGSFEGANILRLAEGAASADDGTSPAGLDAARRALYEARAKRVWPALDDKRLTAWNTLAIAALAEAGAVLGREDYLDAARFCAEFVLSELRDGDGHLLRTYKDGEARLNAYLEDHAFLLEALLVLYEASFEPRWYEEAVALAEATIARFGDAERGGFFSTSADHEELIVRRKELGDHPIPAGNSAAALGLLRLAALSGEGRYAEEAAGVLRLFARIAVQNPQGFAHLLRALDLWLEPSREVALIGEGVGELAAVVRADFRPRLVLAAGREGATEPPLLHDRAAVDGAAAAYVCQNFACRLPVTEPTELEREIADFV
ncbi:MAG TPA: thioredoxin domain-containing protein [Solirubrobacterales bacterium]|nr:thioredoxin domain-containing protein [Solirubrobacterales bacterium]